MTDPKYQTWLFSMLKGGVRKTTSAVFCAEALARTDAEVLVVDADADTQGVTEWTSRIYAAGKEPKYHVAQWTARLGLLVPFVIEQQQRTGAQFVLIDIGGEAPEVLAQAGALGDVAIMPVGPENAELGRLAESANLLRRNPGLDARVLLTRVPKPGQGIAKAVREVLQAEGYQVLNTEIPHNRELYAHQYGYVIDDLGAYAELVDELVDIGGSRG